MNSPKQLARIGIFYLEEAILDVLSKARHQGHDFISKTDIVLKTQKEGGTHHPLS